MRVRLNESGNAWAKAYDKKFKTNYWDDQVELLHCQLTTNSLYAIPIDPTFKIFCEMQNELLGQLGRMSVWGAYGVATISRFLKSIGLFCKRAL